MEDDWDISPFKYFLINTSTSLYSYFNVNAFKPALALAALNIPCSFAALKWINYQPVRLPYL